DTGPVGWVVEGRFHPRTVRAAVRTVPEPDEDRLAATVVGVLPVHLGDDPRAVVAAGGLGYAGLVVDAFGAGHVPPSFVEPLAELARTMPVVLASRTGGGPVHTETYAYPGSETELLAKGLLPAGWLDTRKARVLLTLLLAAGGPREEIGAWFTPAHDARATGPGQAPRRRGARAARRTAPARRNVPQRPGRGRTLLGSGPGT